MKLSNNELDMLYAHSLDLIGKSWKNIASAKILVEEINEILFQTAFPKRTAEIYSRGEKRTYFTRNNVVELQIYTR